MGKLYARNEEERKLGREMGYDFDKAHNHAGPGIIR